MADIIDRLRGLADVFEAQQAPHNLVLHLRAGADEIERLRAGGCARDQGTTQYCAEAAKLAAENERLRAALGYYACKCKNPHTGCAVEFDRSGNARCGYEARAALEEGRT